VKRKAVLFGAVLVLFTLAGCGGGPTFMRNGGGGVLNGAARADRLTSRPAPFVTTVSDGQVVVDGPIGFCVDRSATKDNGANAFVLLGNCASLSNAKINESSNVKALLTASLAKPVDGDAPQQDGAALAAFFNSDAGRGTLSRENTSGPVNIIETFYQDDVFYVYPDDGGSGARDLDATYWRAILVIKGRLVSLTVQDFASQKLGDAESLTLLQEFAATMQAANGGAPMPVIAPVIAPVVQTPVAAAPARKSIRPRRSLVGVGLLRRILQ